MRSVGWELLSRLCQMSLSEDKIKLIREAVESGKRANPQAMGRVTLPLGGKRYAILANGSGPTPAGKLYKELVGSASGAHGLAAEGVQTTRAKTTNR